MSSDTKAQEAWSYHGPAKPTPESPEGGDYCIRDSSGNIIAEAFYRSGPSTTHNAQAHARLMSASPALLRGLVSAREMLVLEGYSEDGPTISEIDAALTTAGWVKP